MQKLPRDFYARDAQAVVKDLLGKVLVTRLPEGEASGIIVECEAYLGTADKAAHSISGRRTKRNEVLVGPPGHAYVYLIYVMYHCFNVVVGEKENTQDVLVRALETLSGMELMAERRKNAEQTLLTSGPGRLAQALGITRELNGADLLADAVFIVEGSSIEPGEIVARPRIGVDYAEEWAEKPLRYYIRDNPFVSKR